MEAFKRLTLLSSVYQEFASFHVESWIGLIGGVDGSFTESQPFVASGLCLGIWSLCWLYVVESLCFKMLRSYPEVGVSSSIVPR